MAANAVINDPSPKDCCLEEETITVRELVAKVRRLEPDAAKDLTDCLLIARESDEEADESIRTIEEILNPRPGRLIRII